MKIKVVKSFLLLIVLALSSCTGLGLVTVNTLAKLTGDYRAHRNLEYFSLERNRLDVYCPQGQGSKLPVVVFFYGGSWRGGHKNEYTFLAEALTSRGFVTVIPNYRIYPQVKFPAFVEDGARALAWVHHHIDEYGGDPNKVFVMGHSAGAHIAALLALDEQYLVEVDGNSKWIRGMIGLAGPYDFLPLENPTNKIILGPPKKYDITQPINYVDGNEPPFLLLHGDRDKDVIMRNSINLSEKIKKKGGQVKTIYFEGFNHVDIISCLSLPLRSKATVLDDIERFVQDKVKE